MKDPLLSGSSAAVLPGTSLQKACKLLVFFCAIHLSVTLVYYMSGSELNLLQFFTDHPQYRKANGSNFTAGSPLSTVITRLGESAATTGVTTEPSVLPDCPETSPLLVGPLRIEFSISVDLEEVRKTNPNVKAGGRYKPKNCKALQKVAMIIPFRKRDEHLKYWLYYLHPILQRQQLDYGVYVINQDGDSTFNRAKLLNIGYAEALKEYDYSCFVFSDVDIIPMDDRNIYKCYSQPRHLSVSMDKFGFGFLATGHSYAALHYQFLMGRSTSRYLVLDTCKLIWKTLQPEFMPPPDIPMWEANIQHFWEKHQFPNCLGAVDGKHVRIVMPAATGSLYYNYKKYFSCTHGCGGSEFEVSICGCGCLRQFT
ncbi:beta-1,4-galactosyltransferase 1 isoform X2 [Hyperolius riggenbachi]|uniref:beta-1,4-galactosyltransferase 1 isoform X2 n=1 Tax=Hyperolius riggenbachi TaxID=752182 RepID=UPI0035A2AFDD